MSNKIPDNNKIEGTKTWRESLMGSLLPHMPSISPATSTEPKSGGGGRYGAPKTALTERSVLSGVKGLKGEELHTELSKLFSAEWQKLIEMGRAIAIEKEMGGVVASYDIDRIITGLENILALQKFAQTRGEQDLLGKTKDMDIWILNHFFGFKMATYKEYADTQSASQKENIISGLKKIDELARKIYKNININIKGGQQLSEAEMHQSFIRSIRMPRGNVLWEQQLPGFLAWLDEPKSKD